MTMADADKPGTTEDAVPTETRTILIVDDEQNNLDILHMYLSFFGYEVMQAINGKTALDMLAKTVPDLIISDISMPGMDGYQLYGHVKNNPDWRSVPFIFLTAHSDAPSIRRGKEIGSDDYLTKPIEKEDLIASVRGKMKRVRELQDSVAATEFEKIDTLKREILTTLTHELKTPLFVIKFTTDMLLDDNIRFTEIELRELLQRLQKSGDRLGGLVEDFLLCTQIETGQASQDYERQKGSNSLKALLLPLVQYFEKHYEHKNVKIDLKCDDDLPNVMIDGRQMKTVFECLIENAIKFSRAGSATVLIDTYEKDGILTVSIQDNGVGISAAELDKIFVKFYQIDRKKVEQQGAGLGLTIARGLCNINGFDIRVESVKGKGSTFYVSANYDTVRTDPGT